MEALFPASSAITRKFPVIVKELAPGRPNTFDGITVEPFIVAHGEALTSLALRITVQNRVIAYSGDTEWTDDLLAVAEKTDLFIAEAYFLEKKVKNHLSYATLREYWHKLNTRKIILTHMSADMLGNLDKIDGETAGDGQIVELPLS
jgi:ribonuclease BN (tRNA processing enzyme)